VSIIWKVYYDIHTYLYNICLSYTRIQAFLNFGEHKHSGISKHKISDPIAWSYKHTDIPLFLENISIQVHPNMEITTSYSDHISIYEHVTTWHQFIMKIVDIQNLVIQAYMCSTIFGEYKYTGRSKIGIIQIICKSHKTSLN